MLKAVQRRLLRPGYIKVLIVVLSLLLLNSISVTSQNDGQPTTGEVIFTIFANSVPVGVERVGVAKTPTGWLITSAGQIAPPVDLDIRSFEVEYDEAWKPVKLTIDSTRNDRTYSVQTNFTDGKATSEIQQAESKITQEMEINPNGVILPDFFFGAYEAMAIRLSTSREGDKIPVYVAPRREVTALVEAIRSQSIQTAQGELGALIYRTIFQYETRQLEADIWVDQNNRLLRVYLPSVQLDIARQDLALVSTRVTGVRNPGDTEIRVPARGFSLAASVTTPLDHRPPPDGWPAVLLVPGTGLVDRDENLNGIPIFGQLAAQLADAGYLVVRYDKRGVGQSGGRPESAGLEQYSDDVRTMVEYLERRNDVNDDKIIVIGHGEGGWIALLAAARENEIDALALLGVPGTSGTDLILEQQKTRPGYLNSEDPERNRQVALQTQIIEAVLGEGTWDNIPENLRLRADTRWFRSFLEFDLNEVVRRTRQPILIIHGDADQQIPIHHSDHLASLAETRRRQEATVEVIKLTDINHQLLIVAANPVNEYSQLFDRHVSPEMISSLTDWLDRTLPSEN
jgi:hypothetical protein